MFLKHGKLERTVINAIWLRKESEPSRQVLGTKGVMIPVDELDIRRTRQVFLRNIGTNDKAESWLVIPMNSPSAPTGRQPGFYLPPCMLLPNVARFIR